MAVIKIYRVQNAITEKGIYGTRCYDKKLEGTSDKVKSSIRWVRDRLEVDYDEVEQPEPCKDYEILFGIRPSEEGNVAQGHFASTRHRDFYNMYNADTTHYGCKDIETIYNVWLSGNASYIKYLLRGMYQLVEIAIDSADCFILGKQIMFNRTHIISTEILDLHDEFYRVVSENRNAA